jgi:hypothetical protein
MIITVPMLREAGLSEAQINRVVEIADKEVMLQRREQNRIRQQNHRARNAHVCDARDLRDKDISSSSFLLPSLVDRPLPTAARARDWPRDYREQFWAAYPKKVEKPYALKCLDKVRLRDEVDFAVVLAGVARIDRADPKFIKNPSTWLNRGCWTDGEGPTAPAVNVTLLEEHRRQCLEGSNGKGQAPVWRDTGLGQEGAGDVTELRSASGVVWGKDQAVEGQLAFPQSRSGNPRDSR